MRILKLVVLAFVVTLMVVLTYGDKITVMGRDDGLPIAGVTLLSEAGHILGEYSTGSTGLDTMQLYSEYMLESFIADYKVKGYHSSDARLKTKSVKRYARISRVNRNDSILVPEIPAASELKHTTSSIYE